MNRHLNYKKTRTGDAVRAHGRKGIIMKSTFEKMGGTYTLGDDGIYYPDLTISEGEKPHYGKYGMLRKSYLKEHHGGLYSFLLLSGNLTAHLNEIDDAANAQMELLVPQMMEKEGIDETMKARDQIAWLGAVNNIRNAAEEIVLEALVYA